jgi:AsmA protein
MDGKRATIEGNVADAGALAAGETSPATIRVGLPGGNMSFDGAVTTAGPAAQGQARIDLSAPRELLAWLEQAPTLPEQALRTASLDTRLDLSAHRVALDQLQLRVDDVRGQGQIAATLAEPPAIEGELGLDQLNLDPYWPPGGAPAPPTAPATTGPLPGWSEEPIDLPLPLPVDLNLRLAAASVQARQLRTGAVALRLTADRQHAAVAIERIEAYGGNLTGSADARPGAPPTYALTAESQGIHLAQLLQALGRPARVDGAAALRLDLTASGANQLQLVRSAAGKGNFQLRDGAIIGINIAGMLRRLMTLGLIPSASEEQRTDFAEAGGSFRLDAGIVHNDDLYLHAPVLRLDGAGTVDLPQRTLDYRVQPQIAASLQGQGTSGQAPLQVGLPFLVQGPLDAPAIRFDLNGTLTESVSSAEDVARLAAQLANDPRAVQILRDQFKILDLLPGSSQARQLLEGVLQGTAGKQGQSEGKNRPSLEDAARGLLKSLGR